MSQITVCVQQDEPAWDENADHDVLCSDISWPRRVTMPTKGSFQSGVFAEVFLYQVPNLILFSVLSSIRESVEKWPEELTVSDKLHCFHQILNLR